MMIRISGSFSQILHLWMVRKGIVYERLETRLALVSQQETVSVEDWRDLLKDAEELCPGQPVGLQIGSEVQVTHTGVLGYLLLNSDNVADALETYLLCERHFYSVNFAELSRGDSGWMLAWPDQLGNDNALFVQVGLAALVTFLRQRFPGGCDLLSVSLTGDAPGDIVSFERFFGCPVTFNSVYPGITFDADTIHRSSTGALPENFRAMRQQQQNAFSSVAGTDDPFLKSLQSVLLKSIPEGGATLPKVALGMNLSSRTLQRRLVEYDLSYQALHDAVREQLARRYLSRTSLMLSEIPLLLGYSDQSAFNRAFRSWTGITPGRFRQLERMGRRK
jgi:AraC-like DNA-binding protein